VAIGLSWGASSSEAPQKNTGNQQSPDLLQEGMRSKLPSFSPSDGSVPAATYLRPSSLVDVDGIARGLPSVHSELSMGSDIELVTRICPLSQRTEWCGSAFMVCFVSGFMPVWELARRMVCELVLTR
jgi:hypothetical protein